MPSGSGGQIGVTRSDSLYLSVQSVNQWTNFVSESLEHSIGTLIEGAITGYKDEPPAYKGTEEGKGDIKLEPNPNAFGHFLRGVFGQSSGTILIAAGSWGVNSGNALNIGPDGLARPVAMHRFLPVNSGWDDRTFLPPYTAMVYKDVGSAFFFQGTVFTAIDLNIQAGKLVEATATVMARKVERYARTTSISALKNPGGKPWIFDMTSVQVSSGGTGFASLLADTHYEQLQVKLEVPIQGVLLLDGNRQYGEFQINGFRKLTVSGTVSFRDQTQYDAFTAYLARSMRITLYNTNSDQIIGNPSSQQLFGLEIDIPQLKYLTWSTPISGPNRLTTKFTAKGELDQNSLYICEMRLINTTSAY
jgi:hypothetical protein